MRLNFGLIVVLVLFYFSLESCSDKVEKPSIVDTKSENVFSARDREALYAKIEKSYGSLVDARKKFLTNSMFAETLSEYQSDFLIEL